MLSMADAKIHDLVIVGAGPAALSCAIYTTREDIETLLYEKAVPGGLISTTDWVDNYPGFPDGIEGLTLGDNMRKQAERFGAVIELGEVMGLNKDGDIITLDTTDGDVLAKSVLIATNDATENDVDGERFMRSIQTGPRGRVITRRGHLPIRTLVVHCRVSRMATTSIFQES